MFPKYYHNYFIIMYFFLNTVEELQEFVAHCEDVLAQVARDREANDRQRLRTDQEFEEIEQRRRRHDQEHAENVLRNAQIYDAEKERIAILNQKASEVLARKMAVIDERGRKREEEYAQFKEAQKERKREIRVRYEDALKEIEQNRISFAEQQRIHELDHRAVLQQLADEGKRAYWKRDKKRHDQAKAMRDQLVALEEEGKRMAIARKEREEDLARRRKELKEESERHNRKMAQANEEVGQKHFFQFCKVLIARKLFST